MARVPLAGLLAALVLGAAAAPAGAAGYTAGAGEAVTTPPRAGTPAGNAADAEFAPEIAQLCPAQLFPDRGRFALQEPFLDRNGNGQWDDVSLDSPDPTAAEPFCDA